MNEIEAAPKNWGKIIMIAVGVLLLATLPLVPWLSRGLKQSGTEEAIVDAGGRASYGKKLVETGDYFMDKTDRDKRWMRDLFGEAYVDELTYVEFQKEVPKQLVGRIAALPYLESLDASNGQLNDDDVKKLEKAVTLKKLWLNSNDAITAEGFAVFANLAELASLALDDTAIDDATLDTVAGLKKLKRLYIANTNVTDAGVAKLIGLNQLLGLGLEGTKVTDTGLVDVAKLSALEEVRLSQTAITDKGIKELSKLPQLKSLTLVDMDITSAGLTWLPQCENLEILDLAGTKVDDSVVDSVAQIPKLVSVSLRRTSVSDDAVNRLKRQVRGATVQSDTGDTVLAQ